MTFAGATFTQPQVLRPAAVLDSIIRRRAIQTLFQPIIHLPSETVVGFSAVSRGPSGSKLESPEALLAAARDAGRLGELDWIFRVAAMRAAAEARLHPSLSWCINVEPAGLAMECPASMRDDYTRSRRHLRAVLEVMDREQHGYARTLLRACDDVRRETWGVALDRVGTDPRALALLPLLQPDVVKLDRSLIQLEPDRETARVIATVRAYAERYQAVIIAEGIETAEHAHRAASYGADYGQGFLFGAPGPLPEYVAPPRYPIPLRQEPPPLRVGTPFEIAWEAHESEVLDRAAMELSVRELERQAVRREDCLVLVALGGVADAFPPGTVERYEQLSEPSALTIVYAEGAQPVTGPRFQVTSAGVSNPIRREWDVIVLSSDYAAAVVARAVDRGHFEVIATDDRDTVVSAAKAFLADAPAVL